MECFGFWKSLAMSKNENLFLVGDGNSFSFFHYERRFSYINKLGKNLTEIDFKDISFQDKVIKNQFYSVIFIDYNLNLISEEGELLILKFESDN
jgi:hypothetical protein